MVDTQIKCNICGKTFENSDKLNQHKLDAHKSGNTKYVKKSSNSSRYKATGIAAAIAIVIILGVYFSESQPSSSNVVQGVQCDPVEGTVFHVHAHLDVIVDGKSVTVPAGIGIKQNECLYWLHTHNTSGVIHIESPEQMTFTLGQFIQVWDNTPGITPTFEELIHGDKNFKVIVNGFVYNDNFDSIPLKAHDEIVIVSGNVPPSIPNSYDFGGL